MAALSIPIISLLWAGHDVTREVAPLIKSISYSDTLNTDESSQPDTLSLVLHNDGRFLDEWYPQKGDAVKAVLEDKDIKWPWGRFEIDDIRFRFSPDEIQISASAALFERTALEEVRSRSFDNIQLSSLLNLIASESGMKSVLTADDIILSRVEQRAESSIALLKRIGARYGLPVNIKNASVYMGVPEIAPLILDIGKRSIIKRLDLPSVVRGMIRAVTIEYYDQTQKHVVTHTAGDASATGAQNLRLYDVPVSNIDEAKVYAEAELDNQKSGKRATGSMTLVGVPLTSGQPIQFIGLGKLPSKWEVISQTTTVTSKGWQTNVRIKTL